MSVGDHLDELRRRLLICLGSVGICVLAMVGFKGWVTSVYIKPYRIAWQMAYEDYLEFRDEQFRDAVQKTMPVSRHRALVFVEQHADGIRAGTFEPTARIATEGGFAPAWVAPGKAGRDAWLTRFDAHVDALWEEARRHARNNPEYHEITYSYWDFNHRYRGTIVDGSFPEKAAIKVRGGVTLPWSLLSGSPLQDFWTFMAAAALFGVIISSPILIWQIWAFVASGLYKKERLVVYRTVPFTVLLLLAGVLFGYYFVVPYGLYFLTRIMDPNYTEPWFQVSMYFKLFLMLTLALGLVFQLPVVMWALARVGLVTYKGFRKHWRWVIMGCFLFSAMLTPPDPFTQVLMAGPMVVLYCLGLFLTWRIARRLKRMTGGDPAT
jgi:sec-independent protein translocase protein TatC